MAAPRSSKMGELTSISNAFPQPHLHLPLPHPHPPQPQPQPPPPLPATHAAPSYSSRLPDHLMHKNRLQEHTQRSAISLPIYQTINEGSQHAPRFRSTVVVDEVKYISPNTFSHRKAAEQDVAKLALECISKKIKDEGCPLIREDTIFCKSILNEFAVKMNLEKPTYNIIQPEGLLPVFISSLVFNGVRYTGEPGRNKKEAEQLAARAVILNLLGNSGSGTILSEIIKSKGKLYAALHKVKDTSYANISAIPQASISAVPQASISAVPQASISAVPQANISAIPQASMSVVPQANISAIPQASISAVPQANISAIPQASISAVPQASISAIPQGVSMGQISGLLSKDKEVEVHVAARNASEGAIPGPHSGTPLRHELKVPKTEPPAQLISTQPLSQAVNFPIEFVPAALPEPSSVGPSSSKRGRKNRTKANKKLRSDTQLSLPLNQAPHCSVAQ